MDIVLNIVGYAFIASVLVALAYATVKVFKSVSGDDDDD